MVSINHENKIQFIKDALSKGSLDNLLLTLETLPSGDVHRAIHDLWPQFHKEHDRLSLGNLTIKDPVCQFFLKNWMGSLSPTHRGRLSRSWT